MGKKLLVIALLLTGVAMVTFSLVTWVSQPSQTPDVEAQPQATSDNLREVLGDNTAGFTTSTTRANPESTTTTPPPPRGDIEETKVVCATPVELTILLSDAEGMAVTAPIDVVDRFYPEENRLDLHVGKGVTGLPCADTELPVKILGHKQDHFCSLVLEDRDACPYGVSLGDRVLVKLEDGVLLEYFVGEPIESEVATPLVEIYGEFYRKEGIAPTPAVMFRKFTEYEEFYDEIFLREDARDEMWLFTSCGHDIRNGHSQDACAVRTEFSRLITSEELQTGFQEE